MTLQVPYPEDLLQVAKKVVWFDDPEQALSHLRSFLAQVMVYGSASDVEVVRRYIPTDEFRRTLEHPPSGVFTTESWRRWHESFGMPVPPLPRRRFPDGTEGPDPSAFPWR